MNLHHLAIFHEVAQERSVSKGAERLMISQPAVSKQLRELERAIGARLFDRLPRGVRLTEAGELLLSYSGRIFGLAAEAQRALEELRGLARGRVRIGASTTIGVYLLPELLVRFQKAHPGIHVQPEVSRSDILESRLMEAQLDVAFAETFSGRQELVAEVFGHDELVAIARPAHPLARNRRVSAARFCNEPFIVRDTGSETKSFVQRALAAKGLTVRPVMSLGSTEAIKRAVAAGIGVGLVSRLSIGLEVKVRRLAVVRLHDLSIQRPLYCVRARGASFGRAAQELLRFMSAGMSRAAL